DPPKLTQAFLDALHAYAWPGNVRELRNVVERAVVLCSGAELTKDHIPPRLLEPREARQVTAPVEPAPSSGPAERKSTPTEDGAQPADAMERLKTEMEQLERQRIME